MTGTAEEDFLLAGNQGEGNQVALPELPYSREQLQQMQAAAAAIVASKEGVRQCTVVLYEFPMAEYTQHISLKAQEMALKEKDFDIDRKRFGLKQKEDEHSLRMDRGRAELEVIRRSVMIASPKGVEPRDASYGRSASTLICDLLSSHEELIAKVACGTCETLHLRCATDPERAPTVNEGFNGCAGPFPLEFRKISERVWGRARVTQTNNVVKTGKTETRNH